MKYRFLGTILTCTLFIIACSTDNTEDFIGTWTGQINCMGDVDSLTVLISSGIEDNEVIINLEDTPSFSGLVDGDDLIVNDETIPDGPGETIDISINGSISDDGTLTMNFDLEFYSDGILEDAGTCQAIMNQ